MLYLYLILVSVIILHYYRYLSRHYLPVAVILILCIIIIKGRKIEKFANMVKESKFLGIEGPSTINNLQNLQDRDIQHLEHQIRMVKAMYQKRVDTQDKEKIKKIPFENSCQVISSANNGTDLGYNSNDAMASPSGKFTKPELINVLKKLRNTIK